MNSPAVDDDDNTHVMLDFIGDDLDPAALVALIPLDPGRPKKKGDPMGRPRPGIVYPVAKTGVCGFSSHPYVTSKLLNDHMRFMINIFDDREAELKKIIEAQKIRCKICVFEGNSEGQKLGDIEESILKRMSALGIALTTDKD